MAEEKRTEYMAVACFDDQGYPDFYRCKIEGNYAQYDCGDFYRAARTAAEAAGFCAPMVSMDSEDPGFEHMRMSALDWDNVPVVRI
mgnify:CR=1 FL=1